MTTRSPATTLSVQADRLLREYRDAREPSTVAALFDLVAPGLFRLARTLVGDAALAEDVLQETFLVVLQGVDGFDPAREGLPWLTGILRRQAAAARRQAARTPDARRVSGAAEAPSPLDAAAQREEAERLDAALSELDEPYRGAALLRWKHGLEPAEIADVQGAPPGTIWSLLSRAKAKLRRSAHLLPAIVVGVGNARGLSEVRRCVIRRAHAHSADGALRAASAGGGVAVGAGIGGLLVAKKTIVASALLLSLAGAVFWFSGTDDAPAQGADPGADLEQAALPERRRASAVDTDDSLPITADVIQDAAAPGGAVGADRERDLFGVVVDDAGQPIAGAALQVEFPQTREWWSLDTDSEDARVAGPETTSAEDGTFSLRLRRGDVVDVRVTRAGYASHIVQSRQAGERVRIVMARGPVLKFRVSRADGTPATGATVTIWRQQAVYASRVTTTVPVGADGVAVFDAMRPGQVYVSAGFSDGGAAPLAAVTLPAEGEMERTFVIPEGRTITGTITDRETGEPVEGARVGEGWIARRTVLTDAEGRYELRGFTGESYRDISVLADGYGYARVREPKGDVVDVRLARGDRVTGRILGPDGVGVAGVDIVARGRHSARRGDSKIDARATVSDEDGRFVLPSLRRDLSHTLVIGRWGLGRVLMDVSPAREAGEIDVGDVRLVAGHSIAGTAHDVKGRLRAGTLVRLTGGAVDRKRLLAAGAPAGTENVMVALRTDDLGRFRFADLGPGNYELRVGEITQQVTLRDGDVTGLVFGELLEPEPEPDRSYLRFLVRDEAGQPLPFAAVMVMQEGSRVYHLAAGADGVAELRDLAPVASLYTVEGPAGERRFAQASGSGVVPAGQDVDVTLREYAVISGRVVDARGEPLAGLTVFAHDDSGEPVLGSRDLGEGRFEIEATRGRTYLLKLAEHTQRNERDGTILMVPSVYRGEAHDVAAPSSGIVLRATVPGASASVTIYVVDADGKPIEGAHVIATAADRRGAVTDDEGRVKIDGLTTDEQQFVVSFSRSVPLPLGMLPPPPIAVVPDGQTLEMHCRAGAVLEGRVVGPDGEPRAGASVVTMLADRSAYSSMVTTAADGSFSVTYVPGVEQFVLAQWDDADGQRFVAIGEPFAPGNDEVELTLQADQTR